MWPVIHPGEENSMKNLRNHRKMKNETMTIVYRDTLYVGKRNHLKFSINSFERTKLFWTLLTTMRLPSSFPITFLIGPVPHFWQLPSHPKLGRVSLLVTNLYVLTSRQLPVNPTSLPTFALSHLWTNHVVVDAQCTFWWEQSVKVSPK